jgi:hypothetical protein
VAQSAEEIARELQEKAEAAQTFSRNHYRINAMKSLSGQRRALPREAGASVLNPCGSLCEQCFGVLKSSFS